MTLPLTESLHSYANQIGELLSNLSQEDCMYLCFIIITLTPSMLWPFQTGKQPQLELMAKHLQLSSV